VFPTNINKYTPPRCVLVARGSVVAKALRYKPEGRGFEIRWGEWMFFNLPNPSVGSWALGFIQLTDNVFGGVKSGRCIGLTSLPPSVSRLSRQCGILNISQPYRPPWTVPGIALLYFTRSGYDSRRYQFFWDVVGLKRGPLSLVSTTEELLERKNSSCGLENRECRRRDSSLCQYS
jgi:hypothetical protein